MQSINAIPCNFTLIESDSNETNTDAETRVLVPNLSKAEKFNCEENDDSDYTLVNSSEIESIGNRFNLADEGFCVSSKRFTTPKFLNNIYNQLTPVLNGITFVQRIQIVECR